MTRLVLVRHGESVATVEGRVGGAAGCGGLTPTGRRQAEALRDRWARTGEVAPDVIVASTLPRAIETAEVVAEAFPGLDASIARHDDLCEMHPGDCDGMTWDEYNSTYGELDVTDTPMSPGGESLRTFQARVDAAVRRLLDEHAGQTVVVCSHGGFIVAASLHLLGGLDMADHRDIPFSMHPSNTGITEWSALLGGRWQLDRYNDTAHLADLRAD